MALSTNIKGLLNRGLSPFNLRIETLCADRTELKRLQMLDRSGRFTEAAFPVLRQFLECNPQTTLAAVDRFRDVTEKFSRPGENRYSYANNYFSSPDAEVAYALVRDLKPSRIIEVGSGNSTMLFREVIRDGGLKTELVSIDPSPRKSVEAVADRILKCRLEEVPASEFSALRKNDILFIDSSHEVRTGNDVVRLFLGILPSLDKGVVIHVHDIFLPYEYPRQWVIENRWQWTEQYLVQAMLQGSEWFDVLWAGYYFQKTVLEFARHFNAGSLGDAKSMWLCRRA